MKLYELWFLDKIRNDVDNDNDNKPQIHNIFFSLTHTKYKPSHIFYIGQYKKFISKTKSSIGFPRGSILNIGNGIVGVKSIEHATMIMLMGYNAISFSEIAEKIGNSVGMFKK